MKSITVRSLAVSLAVAAAIAIPTAVKAQANSLSDAPESTPTEEKITTESNVCIRVPGFGIVCF